MAISSYTITNSAATAITGAGESGSCWLKSSDEGQGKVYIYHKTGAAPSVADVLLYGKQVFVPNNNSDVILLTADGGTDIFYAAAASGDEATLLVDVV